MDVLPVTWQRVLKIWWYLVWRSLVIASLVGSLIGFLIGIVGGIIRLDQNLLILLSKVGGAISGGLVAVWVTKRMVENKRFSDFRIVLISTG